MHKLLSSFSTLFLITAVGCLDPNAEPTDEQTTSTESQLIDAPLCLSQCTIDRMSGWDYFSSASLQPYSGTQQWWLTTYDASGNGLDSIQLPTPRPLPGTVSPNAMSKFFAHNDAVASATLTVYLRVPGSWLSVQDQTIVLR